MDKFNKKGYQKRQGELNTLVEELMRTTVDAEKNRGMTDLDAFKGVTRSLVRDALKALSEMEERCYKSQYLAERHRLLHHILDYLKRFCERKEGQSYVS